MILVHNLTKRYGAFTAVDQLSFQVEPGVILGLLGPNGAGKTTTLLAFPAWMEYGPSKSQGIDHMGGMMVSMLITGILLALALLVPAMCGGAVAFRLLPFFGVYSAIPAALGALAVAVSHIPALRATRINPIKVLKAE